jgi:hypothetical protein
VKLVPIFTEPVSVGNSNCIFLRFSTILTFRAHIQKEVIFDLKRENQFLPKEIWESIHYKKRLAGVGTVKTSFRQKRYHTTLQKRLAWDGEIANHFSKCMINLEGEIC